MQITHALVLGAVEGLTEFLPISSTGHLILAGHFLGLSESESSKAFDVVIQSGAIAAVVWHYRERLLSLLRGALRRDSKSLEFLLKLFLAFIPAAVIGLAVHKKIKESLFGVGPVIGAMIVGGVLMILIERFMKGRGKTREPSRGESFKIGIAQCAALWPGTSRSMATILGARLVGLDAKAAAEFSFLLAIPTLFAATGFDLVHHRHELLAVSNDIAALAVGTLVSFVVALFVIRAFLGWLAKHSLEVFGFYRIILGLILILAGVR